ncbi:DUF3325 domain-containing protein [Acidovorax sp. HDW3]|jgi:hypothetical protein|uniref:DUF3325 domain-containing protein n=1 Tax=Acidovorax sp. HDW3 TaxID=2714923 RepID=UPI00140C0DDC|nr:DUF3325 domain-containing protein [Acidovorax sp. HDW3]QIL43338.1 DUF3325 domain-containing protein [Acidovorax sp. HDW3]
MDAAFLLCFAGWCALALGMDRHHLDVFGSDASTRRLASLRACGWLVLLLSLALALQAPGVNAPPEPASLRATAWAVVCSLAAFSVAACLSWWPRHAPTLAPLALTVGLLLHASH